MSTDCEVLSAPGASISGTVTGEFSPSGLKIAGKITVVTLNATTWTALPPTSLVNRNAISIQNQSSTEVKLAFDPLTVGYLGPKVSANGERFYDIKDTIAIYGKCQAGTCDVLIEELS